MHFNRGFRASAQGNTINALIRRQKGCGDIKEHSYGSDLVGFKYQWKRSSTIRLHAIQLLTAITTSNNHDCHVAIYMPCSGIFLPSWVRNLLEFSRALTPHAQHEFALCMYCVTRRPLPTVNLTMHSLMHN